MDAKDPRTYYPFRIDSAKYKIAYQNSKLVESLRLFGALGTGPTQLTEIEIENGKDAPLTCNTSDPTRFCIKAPTQIFNNALFISRHWQTKSIDLSIDPAGNVSFFSMESLNE